ncbi:MAG: amidohydrolase family protein [Gammaproteobacteria bacterium]
MAPPRINPIAAFRALVPCGALWCAPATAAPIGDGSEHTFATTLTRSIDFTTSEGTRMNPDVSPDGQTVVFDLLGDLYAMPIAGGRARPLTRGPAIDYRPRFSPDGRKIAFVSDRNGTDNLWIVNADGSDPVMVSAQDPLQRPKATRFFMTPAWTPDGRFVCAAEAAETSYYNGTTTDDILLYPIDPRQRGKTTSALHPNGVGSGSPRSGLDPIFSADGRYLYYSARTSLGRFNSELLQPLYQVGQLDRRTSQFREITQAPQGAFTPRLAPNGRWLVYAVRYDADTGLRVRDLEEGTDRSLLFPVERDSTETSVSYGLVNAFSFLPDSSALVTSYGGKLWRVAVPSGNATEIPFTAEVHARLAALRMSPQQVATSGPVAVRYISDAVLSPDGKQLAFRAVGRIWIKAWPSGNPKRITQDSDEVDDESRPVWSPDGRSILFAGFDSRSQSGHIYEAALRKSSGTPVILSAESGFYASPTLSPDGKYVVALRSAVGRQELFAGFSAFDLVLIPRTGGPSIRVAPLSIREETPELQFLAGDSSRVFYVDPTSAILVSIDLRTGERREHLKLEGIGLATPAGHALVRRALLSPDGKSLLLHDNATRYGQIDWVDLSQVDLGNAGLRVSARIGGPGGDSASSNVKRLSTVMGGSSPFWSADHRAVYFMVADRVFRAAVEAKQPPAQSVARIGLSLPRAAPAATLVIRGAHLLTFDGDLEIPDGDLVIEDGRITALGASGTVAIASSARVIDAHGKTAMPGFISTHSHHFELYNIGPPSAFAWILQAKLAYGFTTVFDPAAPMALYSFSDLAQAGRFEGPRILQTGPIQQWDERLNSSEDARRLVKRNRLHDDCCVKVYDIGGRLNRQWMWNAAEEAGLIPVPEADSSLQATLSFILDGVAHVAHGMQMPVYDDVRQLLGRSGSSMSYQFTVAASGGPTALSYGLNHDLDEEDSRLREWVPYEYLQSRDRRRLTVSDKEFVFQLYGESLARLMDAGMRIHLGEHGVMPGLANHWGIWDLASGAGNKRALAAATVDAAYALGVEREIGTLQPGKLADIVILDGNPMEDIRATSRVRWVIRGGELFDPSTLSKVLPAPAPAPAPAPVPVPVPVPVPAPAPVPGPVRWWTEGAPQMRENAQLSSGGR